MPFVKDTSYRETPFSLETPDESYHHFMSLKKVREKISRHRNHLYRCRTVGVIFYIGQDFSLHELDDSAVEVRVSLVYLKEPMPFTGLPFTAQLFGFVHWRDGAGPVIFPQRVMAISPSIAKSFLSIMKWVIKNHLPKLPNADGENKKKDE